MFLLTLIPKTSLDLNDNPPVLDIVLWGEPLPHFRLTLSVPECVDFPNKISSLLRHNDPECFPIAHRLGETNGETNFCAKFLFPERGKILSWYRALDEPEKAYFQFELPSNQIK
jgi:hypothetical protein